MVKLPYEPANPPVMPKVIFSVVVTPPVSKSSPEEAKVAEPLPMTIPPPAVSVLVSVPPVTWKRVVRVLLPAPRVSSPPTVRLPVPLTCPLAAEFDPARFRAPVTVAVALLTWKPAVPMFRAVLVVAPAVVEKL